MNLIEQLGLEVCRKIVDGAPNWAGAYNTKSKYYATDAWFYHEILLSDFKAQIDQYYYGQSEEKELEQYALLSQEKIEGGASLVGNFTAAHEQLQNELNICSERDLFKISNTDHCSDIANHISPNTKVFER